MLDPTQTVATLVLDHSGSAEVFQRHRIDFCCKGGMTIEAAARERGVDLASLLAELQQALSAREGGRDDPRALSTPRLVEHLVSTHHAYLRRALPFVEALALKVHRVHAEHDPRLAELEAAVVELVEALEPHLDDEEQSLFPAILRGDEVAPQLAAMQVEHLAVAKLLERIRSVTSDFSVPGWACTSYRTLFSELEALEHDTFTHVHLENHVLAPRATGRGGIG